MTDPDTLALLRLAAAAVNDKKAFELVVLDLDRLTSYTDALVICSAASDRQVAAIADSVQARLREAGRRPLHAEGAAGAEWLLLDYGELVVHVFTEAKRAYYGLDKLWDDAPRIGHAELGLTAPGNTG